MRILRLVFRGIAVLFAVAVVAVGGVYALTESKISARAESPDRPRLVVTPDSALLARGERLITTDGCQDCHTQDLGGQVMVDDPAFGRLVASNLTTGPGGVLARYDDAGLDAAIRDGVGWDGRKLIFMPSHEFATLADNDVAAIIAHLRTVAPVSRTLPVMRIGLVARGLAATGRFVLLPYDEIDHARTTRLSAPVGGTWIRGYVDAVVIGCGGEVIARHPRCYDREDMVFDPVHYLPLIEKKSEPSRRHRSEPDGERLGPGRTPG